MIVRRVGVIIVSDRGISRVRLKENIRQRLSGCLIDMLELRAIGHGVDISVLLDVPSKNERIGYIQQERMPKILLNTKRAVIISRRLGVHIKGISRVWRKVARGLGEGAQSTV